MLLGARSTRLWQRVDVRRRGLTCTQRNDDCNMWSLVVLAVTMATAAVMLGSTWMLVRGRSRRACAPSTSRFDAS
eukprot:4574578-Pyramimonas_sp.AAC.1